MGFEVIAYTLIVSSGTGIVYVALIVFETTRGNRLAARPRAYLDRQLLGVARGCSGVWRCRGGFIYARQFCG